ncbi:MAG: DASS family sodium-coupled anion symporter [Pseudomonadota bacterium]
MNRQLLILTIAIAVALALYYLLPYDPSLNIGLSIFALIGILWLTEALHVTITALLVPVIAVLLGVFDVKTALANFANPIIFLFLGGFALAAALRKQGLDAAIARRIVYLTKGNFFIAAVALFAVTSFFSMWISNTATTAMMLPLALGMLAGIERDKNPAVYLFVLLGVAYSANIGGMGSLVGSPPNAIVAAAADLDFASWMKIGLPIVFILFPIVIGTLYFLFKPDLSHRFSMEKQDFAMTRERYLVIAIFAATVILWVFSKPISQFIGVTKSFDSVVAISAVIALCLSRVVTWKDIEKNTEWGVLLLFGGGLTLSAVLQTTGASEFLANLVGGALDGASIFWVLLAVATFVIFLTELTSNTATAALLVPIFMSIGSTMNMSPTMMALAVGLSTSCAFMLPVATPPNALVYGTGFVPQRAMMRAGLVLNMICAIVLATYLYLFMR